MRKAVVAALCVFVIATTFAIGAMAHKFDWPIYAMPRQLLKATIFRDPLNEYQHGGTLWRKASIKGSTGVRKQAEGEPEEGSAQMIEEQIRALQALGYASGTQKPNLDGGVQAPSDAGAAQRVLPNRARRRLLVTDGHAPMAWIMDIKGNTLHTWQMEFDDAFPGNTVDDDSHGIGHFRRVQLLPKGELLAIYEGQGLIKVDARSKLIWAFGGAAHHDLQVMPDGTIYTLTRIAHMIPRLNATEPILEDFITKLSADGKQLHSFSILTAVESSPYRSLISNVKRTGDIFHTNSIEVLDGKLEAKNPAFKAGNFLISMLEADAIAVIDAKTERVVWAVAGLTSEQHHPRTLDNGRMMVFDNKGDHQQKSRIVEIDVDTLRIGWEYSGAKHDFYSETCGSAQRLPNGDTLITESDRGRALIVTPAGETIWEYVTPNRVGPNGELIAALFEVFELPASTDVSFIKSKR